MSVRVPWEILQMTVGRVVCGYCGRLLDADEQEDEHPFPRSWYPDGTSPSDMLIVPSCRGCNARSATSEVAALPALVLCLGEAGGRAARRALERVARSMNAAHGTTDRDKRARAAKLKRLLSAVRVTTVADDGATALVTGHEPQDSWIRTPSGLLVRGSLALPVGDELVAVAEKILRGCYFHLERAPFPSGVPLSITFPRTRKELEDILDFIDRTGLKEQMHIERRLGFDFAATSLNSTDTLWIFRLWEEVYFFGATGKFATLSPALRASEPEEG
jgi:hypothetical protein